LSVDPGRIVRCRVGWNFTVSWCGEVDKFGIGVTLHGIQAVGSGSCTGVAVTDHNISDGVTVFVPDETVQIDIFADMGDVGCCNFRDVQTGLYGEVANLSFIQLIIAHGDHGFYSGYRIGI